MSRPTGQVLNPRRTSAGKLTPPLHRMLGRICTSASFLRSIAITLLVLIASVDSPTSALAHANLERAEPPPGSALGQSPHELQLFFSEAVDPSFSRVQLLDDKREQVDRNDSHQSPADPRSLIVSVPATVPNGLYTVAWRTLSAVDGHTVNGAYPLIIGPMPTEGVASTSSASSEADFTLQTAVGRWWFYLTASTLFGTLLSWHIVLRPLFGRSNPAALQLTALRARRLAGLAAVLLLVATLYAAVAQASSAADAPVWGVFGRPLMDLLGRGRYAVLWWPRLGLVLLALGLVNWRGAQGWPGQLALAATAGVLLTNSLNSHAAALVSGAYLAVAADWLHLLGVAVWVGGLLSLVYVLPVSVEASQGNGDRVLSQAVARFSNLALAAVAAIVVTGTFQAWLEVGFWEGLVQTAYGLSVTTKIGLLALTLAPAAFNLLVIRPHLATLAGRGPSAVAKVAQRFRLAIRAELGLLVVILGVAAVLTGLGPAREELARRNGGVLVGGPVNRDVDAEGLGAHIQINPASLGPNRFSVELPGVDPSRVERVQLTLTYLDAELGSQPLVLEQGSTPQNTWGTTSTLLSQAGTWQAELLVRQTNADDARTAIRFLVAGPGGSQAQAATFAGAYPFLPSPLISVAYLLGTGGLVVIAVAVVRMRAMRQRGRSRRAVRRQGSLIVAGLLVGLSGGYIYVQEQRNGVPLDVSSVRDPIAPDARSLSAGKQVYTTYCETCHGTTGRGDGPTGLRLVPRPADLRIHTAPGVHTDGELFYWVTNGYPNSAMPAWKDQLSEEQRWDAINYARATFGNAANQAAAPMAQ